MDSVGDHYTLVFNGKLMDWLIWYNTKRFHWGLNLEAPINYLLINYPLVQYALNQYGS